jgi:hypothetical protein
VSTPSDSSHTTLFDDLKLAAQLPGAPSAAGALPGCSSGMVLRSLWLVHAVLGSGLLFVAVA